MPPTTTVTPPIYVDVRDFSSQVSDGAWHDAINAAVTQAGDAGGGKVRLVEKEYLLGGPVVISSNNVELVGNGNGSLLKVGDGMDEAAALVHSCSHVTVENLAIDGNKANQPATGTDQHQNGVTVCNADNVSVRYCNIFDCGEQGIYFSTQPRGGEAESHSGPVENVSAIGNRVANVDNGAILFMGGGNHEARNGVAERNTIITPGNEGIQAIDGWRKARFTDNYIRSDTPCFALENHDRDGIRSIEDIVIADNECEGDTALVSCTHPEDEINDVLIKGNIARLGGGGGFIESSEAGMVNRRWSIVDNHFIHAGGGDRHGVNIDRTGSQAGNVEGWVITGNTIVGCFVGLRKLDGPTDGAVITGNTIINAENNGIVWQDAPGAIISGNRIIEPNNRGIVIKSDQGGTGADEIFGYNIKDNYIKLSGGDSNAIEVLEDTTGLIDYYQIRDNMIDLNGSTGSAVNDAVGAANADVGNNASWGGGA